MIRTYKTHERHWDIFFILATGGKNYTINELHALLNKKWSKKTLHRDMMFLSKYGVEEVPLDGISWYKYVGPVGPFIKPKFKYCPKCKKTKPLNQFHKMWSGEFGRRPHCKTCWNNYQRRYYEKNKDYLVDRMRMRRELRRKHKALK